MSKIWCDEEDGAILCAGAGFDPSSLSAVTAWLRNTTLSGGIASVTDVLNSNPAVQATAARQPAGNSDGSMTFSADVLSWPLSVHTNATKKLGFAFWMLPDSVTAVTSVVLTIMNTTGGADLNKIELRQTNDRLQMRIHIDDSNGRSATTTAATPLSATVPNWVKVYYDADGATEADKFSITINTAAAFTIGNIGSGGTIGDLRDATGNLLIGNISDGGASLPFNGKTGRNIFVLSDALTAQQETNLKNFEPLVA